VSLKRKVISALKWTAAAAVANAAIRFIQLVVLVRFLDPEDYGLMALVTVVLSFATLFADLGLNSAYLHRRDVDNEQRSSLFWANVTLSVALGLLVAFTSPFTAGYFGDVRLIPLIALSALVLVLSSFGQQLRTTAQKDLNFGPVVLLETAALLTGLTVSVTLAFLGYGVYSLIWGGIANAIAGSLLSWIFISHGWRPLLRLRLNDIKPFWGFGSSVVGNNIVNQISMTIDVFLGGRILGATQLGIYSVPRNLVMQLQFLINPIATRVGFPLIAKLQDDIERRSLVYLKTLNLTASVNAPIYAGIAVFSSDVVQVIFGTKWSESASVLSILGIWAMLRSFGNPVGSLLLGTGYASLALKWNICILSVLSIILWFGADYGIQGLAWSLLCFQIFAFVPGWYVLVRPLTNFGFPVYCLALLKPTLCALAAVSIVYLILPHRDVSMFVHLLLAVTCSALLYIVLSYVFNREFIVSLLEIASPASSFHKVNDR
jgi:lipopolysaccharide exporter